MGAHTNLEFVLPDSLTLLAWYRSSRALGYGEQIGMYTEESVRRKYISMIEGLEEFPKLHRHDQLRVSTHFLHLFQIVEFEIASQSLISRFKPETLHGMSKKQYNDLFLRYSAKHPETIWAREEREQCIKKLASLGIVRGEWYGVHTKYQRL